LFQITPVMKVNGLLSQKSWILSIGTTMSGRMVNLTLKQGTMMHQTIG
jgi:hypothetical protein